MLSNYPDHNLYFSQPLSSTSIFYVGKSKRKLEEVKVEIYKEYEETRNVEIEGSAYSIKTTYIAFQVTGAISHKDVSEGAHSLQAYSMLINSLLWLFDDHISNNGVHFYENDYDRGWNRRDFNEMFSYLVRDVD